jgi:enamine deaminase RidA (YjgF/YER057c/UK114 family)
MEIQFIHHDPPRVYDKACCVDNLIFLAGEDSKDPKTQKVRGTDVTEQAEFLFQNLKRTLESMGSSLDHITKTTLYLVNRNDRQPFQEVKSKYLKHTPPSTLIMGVQLAEPEMLCEVDAIAVIPNESTTVKS